MPLDTDAFADLFRALAAAFVADEADLAQMLNEAQMRSQQEIQAVMHPVGIAIIEAITPLHLDLGEMVEIMPTVFASMIAFAVDSWQSRTQDVINPTLRRHILALAGLLFLKGLFLACDEELTADRVNEVKIRLQDTGRGEVN